MWLLHTSTRKLRSFEGSSIPPYAILSHTWSADEVLFQHMQKPSKYDPLSKQGYSKIELACTQAQNDGYDYIWIDTCCIDKRSSAELSEAIKSIFRWYQEAAICYAYLADVPPGDGIESDYPVFRHSRWFTRGWTLQELIAPSKVTFFAKDWTDIGNRNDLSKVITEITGVDSSVLKGSPFDHLSVARRMSWAARRETTREEDIAYCLFGLFGVNMPLSYGEGKGAFIKLEEGQSSVLSGPPNLMERSAD